MNQKVVLEENLDAILIHYFFTQWQHSLNASLLQMILVFAKTRITNFQDSGRSGNYKNAATVLGHFGCLKAVVKNNKWEKRKRKQRTGRRQRGGMFPCRRKDIKKDEGKKALTSPIGQQCVLWVFILLEYIYIFCM